MTLKSPKGYATYRLIMIIKWLMQSKGHILTWNDMMSAWIEAGEHAMDFNRDLVNRHRSWRHRDAFNFKSWQEKKYDEIFAKA